MHTYAHHNDRHTEAYACIQRNIHTYKLTQTPTCTQKNKESKDERKTERKLKENEMKQKEQPYFIIFKKIYPL